MLPAAVLLYRTRVLLLKDTTVLAYTLLSVLVIGAVFGHLIDEEEREAFDSACEKRGLLLEVALDGLANLHATNITLRRVAPDLATGKLNPVEEPHAAKPPISIGHDLRNGIAIAIGLKLARFGIDIIMLEKALDALGDGSTSVQSLELNLCLRRPVLGYLDVLQVEIAIGTTHILKLETLDLDALDQPLVVGIQRVQNKDRVMAILVSGRVIEASQGMEALDTLLGRLATHLLRFILDDDGVVCRNDIDGTTTAKLVTLGVHDASLFGAAALLQGGIEGLHVDDHHVDVGTCREAVDLAEARAVVHEVADCLAVLLEEVLLSVLKRLINALANGDGGYHHNELGPAVEAVKFEYGLGIDVGLARARLHLDIDIDGSRTLGKRGGLGKPIGSLLFTNVVEKPVSPNCKRCVGVAFARFELTLETWKYVASISPYHTAKIAQVEGRAQIGLAGKDIRHRPGGSRLIRLDLELELHEGLP